MVKIAKTEKLHTFAQKNINMKRIKYIFLILVAINIISCTKCDTQYKLDIINTYICTDPDSAIKELNKISKSQLTTEQLHAHHALLKCEGEYFQKRKINDSILNIALKYFVYKGKGSASQQMETKLLYLYKNINNSPSKTINELLEMEKQINHLTSPHLKGLLESLIIITYYNNHEYSNMLEHAYKELAFARHTKEINRIINSQQHIGVAYEKLNNYDSAYAYYTSFKNVESKLDSTILSTAYHNLAVLLRKTQSSNRKCIITALKKSLKYNINRNDSSKTYMQIAQCYYEIQEKEKADSFLSIFYKSIRKK